MCCCLSGGGWRRRPGCKRDWNAESAEGSRGHREESSKSRLQQSSYILLLRSGALLRRVEVGDRVGVAGRHIEPLGELLVVGWVGFAVEGDQAVEGVDEGGIGFEVVEGDEFDGFEEVTLLLVEVEDLELVEFGGDGEAGGVVIDMFTRQDLVESAGGEVEAPIVFFEGTRERLAEEVERGEGAAGGDGGVGVSEDEQRRNDRGADGRGLPLEALDQCRKAEACEDGPERISDQEEAFGVVLGDGEREDDEWEDRAGGEEGETSVGESIFGSRANGEERRKEREEWERDGGCDPGVMPGGGFVGEDLAEVVDVERRAVGRTAEEFQCVADGVEPEPGPADEEDGPGGDAPDEEWLNTGSAIASKCPEDDWDRDEEALDLGQHGEAHEEAGPESDFPAWGFVFPLVNDDCDGEEVSQVEEGFERGDVGVAEDSRHASIREGGEEARGEAEPACGKDADDGD